MGEVSMSVDYARRSDKLRIRMSRLRSRLNGDVDDIIDQAQDMLDWKHYLKQYPIASVSVIAALSYFLVPRRKFETNNVQIDEEAIDRLLAARNIAPPAPPKKTLFGDLLGIATQMAFRSAITLVTSKLLADTMQEQRDPRPRSAEVPESSSYSTGVDHL